MRSVGIDLGTTNSVLAANTEVRPVEGQVRVGLMPSAVAFPPNGAALVGEPARRRRVIDPAHTLLSFKRLMGARWSSEAHRRFAQTYPNALVRAADEGVMFDTRAGHVGPTSLSSTVLANLALRTGTDVTTTRVVVTVPSSFDEAARRATRLAASRAGFAEVHLIEEPVAIASAYLHRSSLRYAMVYDLGGGTFDCAVVDCSRYPFEVLGHVGDRYLGGDDVDLALARHVAAELLRQTGWDLTSERTTLGALVGACEHAKIELSQDESTRLDLTEVDPAAPSHVSSFPLSRAALLEQVKPLTVRSLALVDQVLDAVSLRTTDIQAVFLAGGSTALPGVFDAVAEHFGRRPRRDLNPGHVVAIGASAVSARPHLWPLLETGDD